MTRVIALVALVFAAGCTTMDLGTTFSKSNAGVPETSKDELECRREVASQAETYDMFVGGVADAVRVFEEARARDRLLATCMQARGYQVNRPSVWYRRAMLHWN